MNTHALPRLPGWTPAALLALAALLGGCDAPATDTAAVAPPPPAAAPQAGPEDDSPGLLAHAATEAADDEQTDEPVVDLGDEGEAPASAAGEDDDGSRPATVDDLVRGLASLTEAVDAVQRGEDRASQGTAYDGEREYEEWDGAEPPLSVEFQVRPLTAHMLSYRIEVRSRADRLVIHDVTLNRGNCGMAEPGELNEGLKLPVALRYGQKKIVNVRRCDKVLEATVDTQYGAYTFNWR